MLYIYIYFHIPMKNIIKLSSLIAYVITIASNKQRLKHNNLTLICGEKLKEAHEHFKSLMGKTWSPNANPHMVVIKDYYQVTIIDENMYWIKLTRLM